MPLARRVFQPLVVQGEPLHKILAQSRRRPLAKLRTALAAHTVADSEDSLQPVVLHLAGHFACALQTNYPEFPDSCHPVQFALLENVHQVLVDRPHVLLEQLGDERLRQPDRLVLEAALDARAAIFRLVKDDAGLGHVFVRHGQSSPLKAWCSSDFFNASSAAAFSS